MFCKVIEKDIDEWLLMHKPPYLVEPKADGERATVFVEDEVKIKNRRKSLYTEAFLPKSLVLAIRMATHGRRCTLDGEFVSGEGKNFYEFLSDRAKMTERLNLIIFDVLEFEGNSLEKLPLSERKRILTEFLEPNEKVRLIEGKLVKSKEEILKEFDKAINEGWEGVVVKPFNSIYADGVWLKLKRKKTADAYILGIRKTESWEKNGIPISFLIGFKQNGAIKPYGHAGSGLSFEEKSVIASLVDALKNGEDREHIYLEPFLIVEVEFNDKLENSLRSPRILRIRTDKTEVDEIF